MGNVPEATVKYLNRSTWLKTPFAGSRAASADGDIAKLFLKHKVGRWAVVTGVTDDGRPRFGVRFVIGEVAYRVAYDCLDAPSASEAERPTQVKRAVLHRLKTTLDEATVFAPPAELLLPYAVGPTGRTVYEAVGPRVLALASPDLGRLMLGPKT